MIPDSAVDLVKRFEGYSPDVYLCPAGYKTIGYGHLVRRSEVFTILDEDEAEALLRYDMQHAANGVNRLTKVPLDDDQFGALVSFVFNLGSGAYQASTLRAKLNRGEYHTVPSQLRRWVFAGGRKLRGLVRRREAEALLWKGLYV